MATKIRESGTGDFEQVYCLMKEFAAFIKTPEKFLTSLSQMISDKDYFHCYVALDNQNIIGFFTYFFAYYSWSGRAIYLDDLYVLENYRGLGIGNKLFGKVIDTAKANNCKKIRWQVSAWNIKAIEFYKTRGAVMDDIELNCDLIL